MRAIRTPAIQGRHTSPSLEHVPRPFFIKVIPMAKKTPDLAIEIASVQKDIDKHQLAIDNLSADLRTEKADLKAANEQMSHLIAAQYQVDEYEKQKKP